MNLRSAVKAIERHGVLLIYPIDNRKAPLSLWHVFHPRSRMRWEWDSGGDNRVSKLWVLKQEISGSGQAVYAKWYRGRATCFSKEVFAAMMGAMGTTAFDRESLRPEAREVLSLLEMESPLSTKQLKKSTGLVGRRLEPAYAKALNDLWQRLLIVGFGEVADGAFPSLAVGATKNLFEDLWEKAQGLAREQALAFLRVKLGEESLFLNYFLGQVKKLQAPRPSRGGRIASEGLVIEGPG